MPLTQKQAACIRSPRDIFLPALPPPPKKKKKKKKNSTNPNPHKDPAATPLALSVPADSQLCKTQGSSARSVGSYGRTTVHRTCRIKTDLMQEQQLWREMVCTRGQITTSEYHSERQPPSSGRPCACPWNGSQKMPTSVGPAGCIILASKGMIPKKGSHEPNMGDATMKLP